MSFEQLMEHASQIKFLATKHALDNKEAEPEYARNGVDGYYQQLVEPLYKPFSKIPDPAKYQPMIDDLSAVMHGLSSGRTNEDPIDKDPYLANPTLDKMHTASDYLEDWTGQAAMTFKQKFLDPFPSISTNQFILTSILKAALEAHQAMWDSTRKDIDKIAHATMDAFDNKCCDKNTWNVSFTVLSSLGAVGAAILTVATEGAAAPLHLAGLARLLYAAWLREYRAAIDDSALDIAPEDERDHAFLSERSQIESSGASSDGRITFSAVGMQDISVRIVPGTVWKLTEDQFAARTKEAVTILVQDYRAKVRQLKIRHYA